MLDVFTWASNIHTNCAFVLFWIAFNCVCTVPIRTNGDASIFSAMAHHSNECRFSHKSKVCHSLHLCLPCNIIDVTTSECDMLLRGYQKLAWSLHGMQMNMHRHRWSAKSICPTSCRPSRWTCFPAKATMIDHRYNCYHHMKRVHETLPTHNFACNQNCTPRQENCTLKKSDFKRLLCAGQARSWTKPWIMFKL